MKADRLIELDLEALAPKMLIANLFLLVTFAAAYHFFVVPLAYAFSWIGILYFIAGYIILIAIHEFFHLFGFVVFGKVPIRSLRFGVNLSLGIAYATTERPLRNRAIRKALLLPFWMTAVLPAIIGTVLQDQVLVLLGAMLAAGAYGDFVMWQALRKEPDTVWVVDDPELPRLHLFDELPGEYKEGGP